MFTLFGAYLLFLAASGSSAWWLLVPFNRTVKLCDQPQVEQVTVPQSEKKRRIRFPRLRIPRLRIRGVKLHFAPFARVAAYFRSVRVRVLTILVVGVVEPLVVIYSLQNKIGDRWVGILMLVVVIANWVVMLIHLRFHRGIQPQPVNQVSWQEWAELALFVAPIIYAWLQFLTLALG